MVQPEDNFGFVDDEDDDDVLPFVAMEPGEPEETPRSTERRSGDLLPMAGVMSSLYGPGRPHEPGKRAPVLAFATNEEGKPAPFVCPTCNQVCAYERDPLTDSAAEAKRNLKFYRRPLCSCEEARRADNDRREAALVAKNRQDRADRALIEARRGLILPPRLARFTFENYAVDRHKTMKTAYIEARALAESAARWFAARNGTFHLLPADIQAAGVPDAPPAGLVLLGPTGRGKTHLCVAVCRYLVAFGVRAQFANAGTLLTELRKESGANHSTDRLRSAQECDVFVLDDMGMEHISSTNTTFGRSTIYALINTRVENDLPTLATTTLQPKELTVAYGETGPAIVSRLSLAPWLVVGGPDGRSFGMTAGGSLEAAKGSA